MTTKREIKALESRLTGLQNDTYYWELRRQYGDFSAEVLRYLRGVARTQAAGANHT